MVFSSITFLFYFFPAFLACYYFLPCKNLVLLLGSLFFYAWGEPRFVPLLLLSAILNYSVGYAIATVSRQRLACLCFGIVCNLLLLAYFKYFNFLVSAIENVLPFSLERKFSEIALPLGISFFTFQGISYLIDVYRGDVKVQKSFLVFAMYKAMFPQLIAGPIVRYHDVAEQIVDRPTANAKIWFGFKLFIFGLAQKVLIANAVAFSADQIFAMVPIQIPIAQAWAGILCYSIQIFYDFSGYTNMAIGIAHMIGFSYPPNFNQPYSSASITEFWRRWHMSLSSWFRDYLYIPLGGNRLSPLRTYVNLALVFLLCGLWHGAAWTFVIWGAWHGALLIFERAGLGAFLQRLPRPVAQAYTLIAVIVGWVFFRAKDVPYALDYLATLFGFSAASSSDLPWAMNFNTGVWAALALGIVLSVRKKRAEPRVNPASACGTSFLFALPAAYIIDVLWVCGALLLSVASLAAGTYNPFIYFRF